MNDKIKLTYDIPQMSIIVFETEDIITTSAGGFPGDYESLLGDGEG